VSLLIKRIHHVTFPVKDMKKAVDFYENVLGLKKTGEWGNYAVFDVGGVELAFGLNEEFQMYLLVDDVDVAYKTLKDKGVEFVTEPKDQFWGGRTATFVDSDGNKFILESFKKQKP
jgi:catechol 2,3-dioxygenase-like lactoylglutathione lyase family enzyme